MDQQKYYKEYRLSQKGIDLWKKINQLNVYARNLCSIYDKSYCCDESCCPLNFKHLPFQCTCNVDEIIASYAKGNYDFYEVEVIEEFVAYKGAYEISSLLEHTNDAPYKSESLAILKYCHEKYYYNYYVTEYLKGLSPPKGETDVLQEPMEEKVAETENYLDEKEEESNEQREEEHSCLPSNESNPLTFTLYDCPPCLSKEPYYYINECYEIMDSFRTFLSDKLAMTTLTQEERETESKVLNVFPTIVYDNALDDGPMLLDDINYTTIESGEIYPTILKLDKNYVLVDHERHALCDSYIIEFFHEATENYYERGKYGCRSLHVTKTPLFKLKVLKLILFCLPMLVTMFFMNLFVYKIPMHRKYVRLKFVSYFLLDALFFFIFYFS